MPKDLLINNDGNPVIKNGDLAVDETTLQHQRSLLKTFAGEIRQFPKVGIGLKGYLEDDNLQELPRRVTEQMELDGMRVTACAVNESGTLTLRATYDY